MIAFAEHEYALSAPAGQGCTLREHLEAQWAATGRMPEQLQGPELPECAAHVWQWFGELSAARGGNGWGPNPIGYADVAAWAALTRREPTATEVNMLMALDRRYLAAVASRRKADA